MVSLVIGVGRGRPASKWYQSQVVDARSAPCRASILPIIVSFENHIGVRSDGPWLSRRDDRGCLEETRCLHDERSRRGLQGRPRLMRRYIRRPETTTPLVRQTRSTRVYLTLMTFPHRPLADERPRHPVAGDSCIMVARAAHPELLHRSTRARRGLDPGAEERPRWLDLRRGPILHEADGQDADEHSRHLIGAGTHRRRPTTTTSGSPCTSMQTT